MSRQYLKELQQRAQKLLQVSSDQEDINAYTASHTNTHSPARIDLDDYLFEDNQQEQESVSLQNYKNTDIQLLKKCISLTNQNNDLRDFIQKQKEEIKDLKMVVQNKNLVQKSLKMQLESQFSMNKKSDKDNSSIQRQLGEVKRQIQEIKMQKFTLKKQYDEIQREKEKLRVQKQQNELLLQKIQARQYKKQIQVHHDYTIKTIKNQVQEPRFSPNEQQYKHRIKRLEATLKEEKNKTIKLCNFINSEIPQLKDKIVQLTAKLDYRVSKYLLRDLQY